MRVKFYNVPDGFTKKFKGDVRNQLSSKFLHTEDSRIEKLFTRYVKVPRMYVIDGSVWTDKQKAYYHTLDDVEV